ncbi:hypothetical protein R1sor_014034 [Riccia sorocarpa]|uniref:Uncharacterized protein n=1 Tax=Riccia sorocarpa TaxID=122646 RepID=A0ABD3HBZ2_9MARC
MVVQGSPPKRLLTKTTELEELDVPRYELGETGESVLTFSMEWLDLSRPMMEEKENKILARALETNRVKDLKVLFLHKNAGDVGMRAMLNALTLGYLSELQKLILWEVSSYDQITTAEEGTDTIVDALRNGKVRKLQTLDLTGSLPKLVAPRRWKQVLSDLMKFRAGSGRLKEFQGTCLACFCLKEDMARNHTLDCIRCQYFKVNVFTGDDGARKLVKALRKFPQTSLKFLILAENYIGDEGVTEIARLLVHGKLPQLEELDLQNNPVGKLGGETMVEAFLANPLLTVRVKMQWPTLLLKERYSAFRESNIRLEHRLVELKIKVEQDSISELYEWRPQYYLRRPPLGLDGFKHPHRLYMECQAPDHIDDVFSQGEGIQIRRRSCFGTSSRKYVDRKYVELREEKDEDNELDRRMPAVPRMDSMPSSRRNQASATGTNDGVEGAEYFSYQTLPVPQTSSSNRESVEVASTGSVPSSEPISRPKGGHKEKTNRKTYKGVNHIYITAGSCGFIGAAKALGLQTRKGFWRGCYSVVRKMLQNQAKTQAHIYSIMEELLMLADRKPHEFNQMFNLRRVLLQDRQSRYYPAFVCATCYSRLKANGSFVKPIVHTKLLEVQNLPKSSTPTSISSLPGTRKPPIKYRPKYKTQKSRLNNGALTTAEVTVTGISP